MPRRASPGSRGTPVGHALTILGRLTQPVPKTPSKCLSSPDPLPTLRLHPPHDSANKRVSVRQQYPNRGNPNPTLPIGQAACIGQARARKLGTGGGCPHRQSGVSVRHSPNADETRRSPPNDRTQTLMKRVLAISGLAQRRGVLRRHPDRAIALLRQGGVFNDEDRIRVRRPDDPPPQEAPFATALQPRSRPR